MADFYSEMADMTNELLAPTAEDGLGQGQITITSRNYPSPAPGQEHLPVNGGSQVTVLKGAATGVSKKLVGVEVGGVVIVATDLQVIVAPPADFNPGDVMHLDGRPVAVLQVTNIPPVGTVAAVRFVVRG